MNQKQIKTGGFYRIKQDTGQREKVMLCGEVVRLDGSRKLNGRPAAAWVCVRLWERQYGPDWRQQTKQIGGERWVTPQAIAELWNTYALRVDQEDRRRTIDAELAARQADELTRRLTALGVVVPSGLDRPPYLLSHEALCALLQQAEAKAETERLLLQASAERIRIHGLLSALFRSPPNQQASELPMWAVIKDLLHVGATRAHELCAEFGHDPDEKVAGLVVDGLCLVCDVMFCTRCEELTHVPEGHKPQCEHCEPEESAGGAS